MKMTKRNFLVSMVICGAIFLLGMLQYYITNSNPLAGNYMMAAATLATVLIFFALYIKAINKLIRKNGSKYVLFLLPLLGSYFLVLNIIMILDLLDMHTTRSIIREIGATSLLMLSSAGYWSIFIILEATILLQLICKKTVPKLDSENQL